MPRSGIYFGRVTHHRARPRVHDLAYSMFYLLIDLDELPLLAQRSRLFTWNRPGLLSFHDADHGRGDGRPFRDTLVATLREAGYPDGHYRFEVLCLPRMFGYVFNPISVVYCYDDTRLVAMLYEVNNTFGDRVNYLLPVEANATVIRQRCDKAMYVSPFCDLDGRYRFTVTRPGDRLALSIRHEDDDGLRLHAGFTGQRRPWRTRELWRALLSFPFATFKVIAGIHWEALRLWLKGIRFHPRPLEMEPKSHVGTFDH
jgi:uncharacterized protein